MRIILKQTIATAALLSVLFSLTTATYAVTELPAPLKGQMMIDVIVNGEKVYFPDTEPFLDENNRTMVPVRFVSEKLGGEVKWDAVSRTVTITYKSKVITMPLDSKEVSIDDKLITLDTSAVLAEGRTMVPLRFVSEAMETTVTWDDPAHAVKVDDQAFIDKVASGEIKLDPWGRKLAINPPAELASSWNVLSDIPSYAYNTRIRLEGTGYRNNKTFFNEALPPYSSRESLDKWSNMIRQYYVTVLNVDYRTIDDKVFFNAVRSLLDPATDSLAIANETAINNYIKFVKDNHIITKGYADPEPYLTRHENTLPVVRTHFKFMVIQSDNSTQAMLDSYDVSKQSYKIEFIRNVWYNGYSDVNLNTNYGNRQENHMFMYSSLESMFLVSKSRYEIIS